MKNITITTFYKFFSWKDEDVARVESDIKKIEAKLRSRFLNTDHPPLSFRGLIIMGREGINTTLSIETYAAEALKTEMRNILSCQDIWFKDTYADSHPFHDFVIKVRPEIVTLKRPDIVPGATHKHVSPTEWNRIMTEEDPVIIDTRNSYEFELGRFKGAIDPKTTEFSEFPDWLAKSNIPKDKPVLIYCTGGIRCEKAVYAVEEQGYKNVYQLNGGILNYLKEYPNSQFDGECFVFDYRVAVDQQLKPTERYKLCPHCGQPGDVPTDCKQCGEHSVNCQKCLDLGSEYHTCSKNCIHHYRLGHISRRKHEESFRKRAPETTTSK